MPASLVLELFKNFQQRAQVGGPQRTGTTDFLLMLGQIGRQSSLAQNTQGAGTQFPQIELFGLAMLLVIVAAGASIARGQPRRLETAGEMTLGANSLT
jgi:hypothetical protein